MIFLRRTAVAGLTLTLFAGTGYSMDAFMGGFMASQAAKKMVHVEERMNTDAARLVGQDNADVGAACPSLLQYSSKSPIIAPKPLRTRTLVSTESLEYFQERLTGIKCPSPSVNDGDSTR